MKHEQRLVTLIGLLLASTALADGQVDGACAKTIEDPRRLTEVAAAPESAQTPDAASVAPSSHNAMPVYVPPRRGAPKTRVGGGTRSTGSAVQLALLAPEHTGLTGRPSPTLYWWLSQEHEGLFEFVVIAEGDVEPVLRLRQQTHFTAGIHALDLEAAGLMLKSGVAYRWSVAIVRDETRRARDVVALATMEYVLDQTVAQDTGALAAAGLWYDALAAASAAENASGRADLLEQVSLDQIAHWSRSGS
jgi:hypothetical protein